MSYGFLKCRNVSLEKISSQKISSQKIKFPGISPESLLKEAFSSIKI